MRFASHFESLSSYTISFVRHEVPRKRLCFRVQTDFNSAITTCPLVNKAKFINESFHNQRLSRKFCCPPRLCSLSKSNNFIGNIPYICSTRRHSGPLNTWYAYNFPLFVRSPCKGKGNLCCLVSVFNEAPSCHRHGRCIQFLVTLHKTARK